METGTRMSGPAVLVANTGTFEAVTLLKVRSWSLPDTNDPTLSIRSIVLFAPWIARDSLNTPMTVELDEPASVWDTTAVSWGTRPAVGPVLGQVTQEFKSVPLEMTLTLPSPLDSLKKWARDPSSMPGFLLRAPNVTPGSIASYKADSVYFRVAYNRVVSGTDTTTETRDSYATTHLYVHSPATSLATGSELLLRLGSPEGFAAPLHFAVPALPAGAAVNEVTLYLRVDSATDSIPYLERSRTVDLEVRLAGADWLESVTSQQGLAVVEAPIGTRRQFAYRGVSDSLITIRLPLSTLRAWASAPSANYGLVLTALGGDLVPPIFLDSRESSRPPELHVSYTTPPKERF